MIRDYLLKLRSFAQRMNTSLLQWINISISGFLFVCFLLVIYDIGFTSFWARHTGVFFWLQTLLRLVFILMGLRILLELFVVKKKWARAFTILEWTFIIFLAFEALPTVVNLSGFQSNELLLWKMLLYGGITLIFFTEASYLFQFFQIRNYNPAVIFVSSFALFIFIGTLLLWLPNANTRPLSLIDALFTATSAVCVTGLTVVDTATQFTTLGQLIILSLIQIGGLGIMTFAGLFGYAVAGRISLRSQMAFKDMFSSRQLNNVMHFVYQVVFVTFLFEGIGAACIYFSLDGKFFEQELDRILFSVFHSVSAFCNAGFSSYTNGLYEPAIRFNYALHMLIAVLVILGGMGFPIIFNLYRYLKIKSSNLLRRLAGDPKRDYLPKLINLNSRLALVVSVTLLLVGFIIYLLFEQSATLAAHPTWYGKLITSFFGSVTPRTAGFNTVDITTLSFPTIMIYLLLMWIGASPGSTGGGVKTTTVGVAFLNAASVLQGKDRTEFFKSEISDDSTRRAFTIIILSLVFIGLSTFLISVNDGEKGILKIAFEAFSAFSTVGLSLGVTPQLSVPSKLVVILTMFIGRVGTVTLLIAFIRQAKKLYYRYPKEEVIF